MKNKKKYSRLIQYQVCKRMLWLGISVVHFFFSAILVEARGSLSAIEQITLIPEPPSIQIQIDRHTQYRAVKTGQREVMIAFKSAMLSKKFHKQGEKGALIREFTVEQLQGSVVALMVATDQDIGEIQTTWDENVKTLTVYFYPLNSDRTMPQKKIKEDIKKTESIKGKSQEAVNKEVPNDAAVRPSELKSEKKAKLPPPPAVGSNSSTASASTIASKTTSSPTSSTEPIYSLSSPSLTLPGATPSQSMKMTGGADDLLLLIDGASCPEQTNFQEALRQCNKKNWIEAFQLLNADIQSSVKNNCQEKMYYLRAFAYYKMNQQRDEGLYLEVLNQFQDAVSYYPNSIYAPYALATIGIIYTELKNFAEAKGYFKIILEKHKDYPGRPEVMFKLGQIYAIEKNMRMSIPIFKEIIATYPENHYATEVKLELGKALYNSNQYSQALELLNDVLAKEPRKATDLEDMLLFVGNSYYQLGKYQEARDALIRAFNIFPNSEANPVTLTRIGDLLRDTGQTDKANKIYQVVMDRFAGTDGCVISAMRRAALVEDRAEKESIYRMIMEGYPKHPMASLAVVKLSDLQYKAAEYRTSIETLRPLYMANPKHLRAELSYIMQASFKGLLSEMVKADAYPKMVAITQKERQLILRFEQPELFMMLGIAHFKGHLHTEAAKLFEKADKFFNVNGPPELYFNYGMALHASGDTQLALKKLQEYIQKAPQGEFAAAANLQIGRILIDQKDPSGALSALKKADALSKVSLEKFDILRLTAEAHSLLGDLKTAARLQSEVVHQLSSTPEKDAVMLSREYQQLGEILTKMKANAEAATAFENALKYNGKDQPPSLLVQLGEVYRKAGQGEHAIKIYGQVLAMDDEFWKNVAKERLRSIQVESKIRMDGLKK